MIQKRGLALLLFTICSTCLALPTKLESSSDMETVTTSANIAESNTIEVIPKTMKIELEAVSLLPLHNSSKTEDIDRNNKDLLEVPNVLDNTELKVIDIEEIHSQSEEGKDFEIDFLPPEHHMPDLTDEEYREINKEGATPWSFLKKSEVKRIQLDEIKPDAVQQSLATTYITIPIVINSQSSLPLSLTINGHNITLTLPSEIKATDSVDRSKTTSSNAVATSHLKDHEEGTGIRQSNRHRSNFLKTLYTRENK